MGEKKKAAVPLVKVQLSKLKCIGMHLPIYLAAYGNKPGFGSPSALTTKIYGKENNNRNTLKKMHTALKFLMERGLVQKFEPAKGSKYPSYRSMEYKGDTDFVLIPSSFCSLDHKLIRLYACLDYGLKVDKKMTANSIKELAGLQDKLEPLKESLKKEPLISNIIDLLNVLVEGEENPIYANKRKITKQKEAKTVPVEQKPLKRFNQFTVEELKEHYKPRLELIAQEVTNKLKDKNLSPELLKAKVDFVSAYRLAIFIGKEFTFEKRRDDLPNVELYLSRIRDMLYNLNSKVRDIDGIGYTCTTSIMND